MDQEVTLQDLKNKVQTFCEARQWDPFHNAKELSIGAITEASELLEHFRFQTKEQVEEIMSDPQKRKDIGEELADVFFFLLRFSQKYDMDLSECFFDKMKKNGRKYPTKEFLGKNHKSTKEI
jgi:NTP pyrophosphatase (non-canonical NTP hydrolase)